MTRPLRPGYLLNQFPSDAEAGAGTDNLLLESGDNLLLESGDVILLE